MATSDVADQRINWLNGWGYNATVGGGELWSYVVETVMIWVWLDEAGKVASIAFPYQHETDHDWLRHFIGQAFADVNQAIVAVVHLKVFGG